MKIHCLLITLFCSWLTAQEKPATPPADDLTPATEAPAPKVEKAEVTSDKVDHRIVIEAPGPKPKPRLFYTSMVNASALFKATDLQETATVHFQVMQGEAEKLTVEILGNAMVADVKGGGLQSWSLRKEGASRFLDVVPTDKNAKELMVSLVLKRQSYELPVTYELSTFGPGGATGFSATYAVSSAKGIHHKLLKVEGLLSLKSDEGSDRLSAAGRSRLSAAAGLSAAQPDPVEFRDTRLVGEILSDEGSASFRLIGTAHVTSEKPVSFRVLYGRAAPVAAVATPDYRLKLSSDGYVLEFQKAGVYPIDLAFVTPVQTAGEWKKIDFFVPGGAVVPIELKGITSTAVFDANLPVAPTSGEGGHGAFLPASGCCQFAWQPERKTSDGKLFFTSESMGEISVGAGLLRQMTALTVKTLQGALPSLKVQLAGAGEILAVEGENVLSWQVTDKRVLEIVLTRPVSKEAFFVIRSQSALDALPVKSEPLRLTPVGAVRHSGYFRVYNRGAVRIEVMNPTGLTQLSPDQYPEAAGLPKTIRQIFHYRYPAATRSFSISAERVKPEINVSQTLGFELSETDRILRADLELEIREAGIREWEFYGPADYSVVSVTGADVSDYVVSEPEGAVRRLKVIFGKEVAGRRLVRVHLEKNEAAKAGTWNLPVLTYPGSTVTGGELGVSAAPGFRVSPGAVEGLAEMPLARLLKRGANLQQAFRIRSEKWKAAIKVEALSQNVQADIFHLYSLKEGTAYVSVLVNYFVTGAPVSEWKLAVPAGIEHLDVDGRDIRDYRNAEGALVVPLHRPVMGAYQLLITYEQKADTMLELGGLLAQEVQAERGFIQVVSPGQVQLSDVKADEHLQKLDPLELPAEYQLMSHAPTLAAWQYQRRPFALSTGFSWFSRGETARQVVEFAEIESRIARDGGVVTVSTFDVRTRGERNLEFEVPAGLQIRDVAVNGSQVTIREDGDRRVIMLPATVGPNLPVRVEVRSSSNGGQGELKLLAPNVAGTTQLMTRWKVKPDTGYQLKPMASPGMSLLTPFAQESGFTWVENEALLSFALIVAVWIFGSWIMRIPAGVSMIGAALVLFAAAGAFYLSSKGMKQYVELPEVLEYSAPMKGEGSVLSLSVQHVEEGSVNKSDFGLLVLVTSIALAFLAFKFKEYRMILGCLAAFGISFGLLSQVGGAGWFFLILGIVILVLWWLGVRRSLGVWRELFERDDEEDFDEDEDIEPDPDPKGGLTTAVLLAGLLTCFGLNPVEAKTAPQGKWNAWDSISEVWDIKDRRLSSDVALQLTGKAGERFLLLKAPATLTKFNGEGLKVVTEGGNYVAIPTADGTFKADFSYQTPAGEVTKGVPVLTGLAAVRNLTVKYEAAGWSIDSNSAVRKKSLEGKGSSAQLWLAPEENAKVVLSPKARDVAAEASRFYIEVDDLFIPGPGVVDGRHRIKVRPAQGQVKQLVLTVPDGFTVSDVKSKLVGPWRFDPVKKILTVELAPFQSKPFYIDVETQRALAELPTEVAVSPMRVQGAAGEVGMLALAFGREAQLDRDEPKGMSIVNIADFGGGLLPRDRENRPTASLQKVYRYSKADASLKVKVAQVAPEVRVDSKQRLSFGEERTVLAVDLVASITRAGVFRLSFPLPKGFEVESLTGPALNHWVEVEEGGKQFVTMNLNGKTLGTQDFSLVLAGATPNLPLKTWTVPKIQLREANRQSGQLIIVPGRGIQLGVNRRKDLSALDPRSVGGSQAGSLAFRLLQKSWELELAVDQLAPSVSSQILHDVDLRDGRSKSRVDALLQVDHASIRDLAVTLPALSEVDAQTVRVSGQEVRDIVNLEENRWQVRFKRRVIGTVGLRIEYEQSEEPSVVQPVVITSARQQESFLALRPGARLRLDPVSAPGWDPLDWVSLPKPLFQLDRSGSPAAFLRSTQQGVGVRVSLKRHAVVSGAKIRVKSGTLLTVLSPQGELMNQAELQLETLQRGSLVLTLPKNSRLFGVFVNEESALVVNDGDSFRFHVTGDAGGNEANVRFTYATSIQDVSLANLDLKAFKIGEPLENVSWSISIPEGYDLQDADGDLDLRDEIDGGPVDRKQYQDLVNRRYSEKEQGSLARLNQVKGFLKAGERDKAAKTLEQVYNQSNLDAASNEDARIKLEDLVTEKAIIGLNTRRQRLYSDNSGVQILVPQGAEQIEAATKANPVFAGNLNYDRNDYQNIISGNDAEVNRMLDTIANKWIKNQRITEPVSQMLDPVIPAYGKSVIFTRGIQVNGDETLKLNLKLEAGKPESSRLGRIAILALIGVCLLLVWWTRRHPVGA